MTPIRLGVVGLGAIGRRIATRLIEADFALHIYDMVDLAARMFANEVGGMMTGSPRMMAESCDVVIAALPSAAAVRDAAFGWEGLAHGFKKGGVLIDIGASDPVATVALAKELADRGIRLVDAPAFGTPEEARAGKLSFIVGGDEAAVERCMPIFNALGRLVLRAGPVGSGQAANALVDFLRGAALLAGSEAVRIAERFGLDPGMLLKLGEALGSVPPSIRQSLSEQVLTRRFDSGFALGLVLKDLEIACGLARAAGINAPLLAACRDAWAAAERDLGSGADHTAMIRWLEKLAPPEPPAGA